MKNLSLNAKILFIISIFVVACLVISTIGIRKMADLNNSVEGIVSVNVPRIAQSKTLLETKANLEKETLSLILETREEELPKINAEIDRLENELRDGMTALEKISTSLGQEAIKESRTLLAEWHELNIEVRKLALENKNVEAFKLANGKAREIFLKIGTSIKGISERNLKMLDEESAATDVLYADARMMIIIVSVVSILSGMLLAFIIMRSLSLSINRVISGLNDSSIQVTSAAQQIAASSQELSQSATEQASSLEETSAAVEEMNSMIQKTSESAQQSSKSSITSSSSAERGKRVVDEMKQAMIEIDRANMSIMNETNENNVKFADIVKVIGEIGIRTKVINDIVFQTKLLSFNASVEAARAGEHGKGFAVVAEEVGNLAQMSGNAAKEISSMLDNSIEKVETIVRESKMSIEKLITASKSKVEVGTRVASDCGEVLDEIVKDVNYVSQLSTSIATASDEQAKGISEITNAVTQLDQMTQQNAAASEETASAAEELSAQADSMQNLVQTLIMTIKGGDNGSSYQPVAMAAPRAEKGVPAGRGSNVLHMGKKKAPAKSSAPAQGFRMASGSEIVPSETDSRFKDI